MSKPTATTPSRTPSLTTSSVTPFGHSYGWSRRAERPLLTLLILLFVVTGFIPAWVHLGSDFPNHYLTARLYLQGYPLERVYEWVWFQRQADHAAMGQRLVGYTPTTLPSSLMVLPLSGLAPLRAKRCWLLLNLAFLLLTGLLLARNTSLGLRRVGLIMFLALIALRSNFLLGQMHVFVLLLLTLAAFLYFEDRLLLSGIALAAAAVLKIYPALFLIFFLIKKQWRAAGGLVVGLCTGALLSMWLFGMNACRVYAEEVLPWAMRAQTIDPYDVAWGSLSALLARLFIREPELNPTPVAHLPWLYALLYSLIVSFIFVVFMWAISFKTEGQGRRKLEWASYLFLLLLLSSQPASYHFVVLVLPAVLVTDYLVEHRLKIKATVLVCIYILACGSYHRLCPSDPTGWQTLLCFPRLFFTFVFGGLLLSVLTPSPWDSVRQRLKSRASLFAAFAFAVLFTGNFTATLRHFKGQFDNYQSRVLTIPGSATATDPVVTSDGLWFTALVPRFLPTDPDTYSVHEMRGGSVRSFAVGGDWFHPAVGMDRNTAWAEVATGRGSRVVRFSLAASAGPTADTSVEIEDAEQPVVSSDGKLLAFIREIKGRDSLWIRQIGATQVEAGATADREIAGPEYDVREAAFYPDHRIIFSSRRGRRFRLYRVDSVSGFIEEISDPACSARYPAISPDGKWMAFSCEREGTWQVHTMNLGTRAEFQFTNGDCNSVSPAWTTDSKNLIYATDCGRGLGLTALAKLSAVR